MVPLMNKEIIYSTWNEFFCKIHKLPNFSRIRTVLEIVSDHLQIGKIFVAFMGSKFNVRFAIRIFDGRKYVSVGDGMKLRYHCWHFSEKKVRLF